MEVQRLADAPAEIADRGNFVLVSGREAAAEIDHAKLDTLLFELVEQHRDLADGGLMRVGAGLLAAGVE
jgi:hypothetical protein